MEFGELSEFRENNGFPYRRSTYRVSAKSVIRVPFYFKSRFHRLRL